MGSPTVENPVAVAAKTFQFLNDYFNGGSASAPPTSWDFILALSVCVDPTQPPLWARQVTIRCLDPFIESFTKEQLLQTFDVCVRGVRRELAEAKTNQDWGGCDFADAVRMVVSDGNRNILPQLTDLTRQERCKLSRQFEQLATESERKATELSENVIGGDIKELEVLLKLLQNAARLREHAAIVLKGTDPEF